LADGDWVREERTALRLTQRELAEAVGLSQPYISQIERGDAAVPDVVRSFLESRTRKQQRRRGAEREPRPMWRPDASPPISVAHWLQVRTWQRPVDSGDAFTLTALPRGGALLLTVDVAGHGASQAPLARYLQGWIRGYCAAAPERRIEVVATDLERELARARASAAWLLVSLTPLEHNRVRYDAVSDSFPAPLLLTELPPRTLQSTGTMAEPANHVLRPPWRLVVATDGLLRRLGGGDETNGTRALLKWHTGATREVPPGTHLSTAAPVVDDELYADITWMKWDNAVTFTIGSDAERHRCKRVLREWVGGRLTPERTRQLLLAVTEAVSNVLHHAYGGADGEVTVAWRDEAGRIRVEVEDAGVGRATRGDGVRLMDHHADEVFIGRGQAGGTLVSLAMNEDQYDGA
jgi:anti-sigma regulatory factor (Ser/Thr protein kinase)